MHGTFWKDAEANPRDPEQISRSISVCVKGMIYGNTTQNQL